MNQPKQPTTVTACERHAATAHSGRDARRHISGSHPRRHGGKKGIRCRCRSRRLVVADVDNHHGGKGNCGSLAWKEFPLRRARERPRVHEREQQLAAAELEKQLKWPQPDRGCGRRRSRSPWHGRSAWAHAYSMRPRGGAGCHVAYTFFCQPNRLGPDRLHGSSQGSFCLSAPSG
uniref:Uncharacterized protein n=1 Tax=Oryza sativa subsp. japonica TaxID=39947 RepID=Q8LNH2_ORYSJ|nr:hypothetical protein [Oryza sativa Japonica Group]